MTAISTASSAKTPTAKPAGRLYPGWPSRIIIGLALAAVVVIRVWMRLDDPPRPFNDVAFGNLVSFGLVCLAALTAWIWLSFFSGHSPLVKLLVRLAPALPLIVFAPYVGVLRLEGFDGDMRPTFVPR